MAKEVEEYLMDKFSTGLGNPKVPLHNHFQEIKIVLEETLRSPLPSQNFLREKLYRLNNILSECQMLSRKRTLYSPEDLLTLYSIKRNLSQIKVDLRKNLVTPNGSTPNPPQSSVICSLTDGENTRWTSSCVDESKVHGFEHEALTLEHWLIHKRSENHFKAIGIVGKSGIGKTTLCQVIFNQKEVREYFVPRIWVCMSRKPNEDEDVKMAIVKRMLWDLGVDQKMIKSIFERDGISGLIQALHVQFNGKRYLIVFDDAKEADPWYGQLTSWLTRDKKWNENLAYGLPKGYGGAVIVTSRDEELAKMMVGEENLHRLLPLADPESCWKIFKDLVKEDALSVHLNLEVLEREIEQKCGGFPLAAKTMAEIFNEVHEEKNKIQSTN